MNAIKVPSTRPALPATHDIRKKNITPNMFCTHGKRTPRIVPSLEARGSSVCFDASDLNNNKNKYSIIFLTYYLLFSLNLTI
jgi:hypothetical protein